MNSKFYHFPQSAEFGRTLPKSKIYEHSSAKSKVKDLFIQHIDKIIWSYKLSPETINVAAKGFVQEIQIFSIELKQEEIKEEILQTIDKAIESPIFYQLSYKDKIKTIAAYKRPSESDNSKWVMSAYFETPWEPINTPLQPLPIVLNLETLYHVLIKSLIPIPEHSGETMVELINRVEMLKSKQKESSKLQIQLKKEKQFNRKVEINSKLKAVKQQIEDLK